MRVVVQLLKQHFHQVSMVQDPADSTQGAIAWRQILTAETNPTGAAGVTQIKRGETGEGGLQR